MDLENESKKNNIETLQQLEKRAWESGCTLDIQFDATTGEGTGNGFIERGSFVATFVPNEGGFLYDPQSSEDCFTFKGHVQEGARVEELPEASVELYETYQDMCRDMSLAELTNDLMMPEIFTEEDVAQLDDALAELTSIDSEETQDWFTAMDEESTKLLNSWAVIKHDYNDDFTVTYEVDGTRIEVEQETIDAAEALHGIDLEDTITELVEEMNKDANIAAFDKAKIDPETL